MLRLRSAACSVAALDQCPRLRIVGVVGQRSASSRPNPSIHGEKDVYSRVRTALLNVQKTAARLNQTEHEDAVRRALDDLNYSFRVAVVGNFNTGKSTIVNVMLERDVTEEGVGVTTQVVHRISYGATASKAQDTQGVEISCDAEWLRDNAIELIDTPGVGASVTEHQEISLESVPHADLLLLVTTSMSGLSASAEHTLLKALGKKRKVAILLNRIDQCNDEKELNYAMEQARNTAGQFLDKKTAVIPISAKLAKQSIQAKKEGKKDQADKLYKDSRFQSLMDYLSKTLHSDERKYIKLRAPLELVKDTLASLQKTWETGVTRLRAVLDPLQAVHDRLDEVSVLAKKDVNAELKRATNDFDEASADVVRALPSAFGAFLGTSSGGGEKGYFSFLNKLRENLNGVVRDAQQQINTANSQLIDAIAVGETLPLAPDIKSQLRRLGDALRRKGEPGSNIERSLLSKVFDDVINKSFRGEHFANYSLRSERTALRLQTFAIETVAVGSALALTQFGHYLHLTTGQILGAYAGCGVIALAGVGWMNLKWSRSKKGVRKAATDIQKELGRHLEKELDMAIRTTVLPLKEAVTEARAIVHAEKERMAEGKNEIAEQQTNIIRLQDEITR